MSSWRHCTWRFGLMETSWFALRQTRLVPAFITVFGWVNHLDLGAEPAIQINSAETSLRG